MAIILLIICLGLYTTFKLNQLNAIINYVTSVDGLTIRITDKLLDAILTQSGFEEKYLISKDKDFSQRFFEIGDYFTKNMHELSLLADTPQKRELVFNVSKAHDRYLSLFKKETSLPTYNESQGNFEGYEKEKENVIQEIGEALGEITEIAKTDREAKIEEVSAICLHLIRVTIITVSIAMIVGVIISFINTWSINKPILLLQEKTREIAKGKFNVPLSISSPPEIKELGVAFNTMCERLKELDDMKIDFISHVSHQLRTPLTSIREASNMLIEGIFTDVAKKQHELFSIIKDECERLINSVNRILDLSRMEAGMMKYDFHSYSMVSIITNSVSNLAPLTQRKEITVEMNLPDDLPQVKINEERIVQVVEELLGNAIKFTEQSGRITIFALHDIENKIIRVSIADTGCSIPKEELDKIFDKFKRIEKGWTAMRGTGLGLSIAKHIIAAHGGKIWAESKPGKGSIFYFTLPV